MATALQRAVHFVEEHVRQERRQRPTLRCALVALRHHTADHHTGVEVAADQPKQAFVFDSLFQPGHQHVVVHAVEELLKVHIDDPLSAGCDVLPSLAHRGALAPARPETMAVL